MVRSSGLKPDRILLRGGENTIGTEGMEEAEEGVDTTAVTLDGEQAVTEDQAAGVGQDLIPDNEILGGIANEANYN